MLPYVVIAIYVHTNCRGLARVGFAWPAEGLGVEPGVVRDRKNCNTHFVSFLLYNPNPTISNKIQQTGIFDECKPHSFLNKVV